MTVNAPLDWKDIKNSAAKFSIRFKDAKKEESYKQTFWNEFFQMFGIDAIEVGMYEQFVKKFDNHTGEIDYFWPGKLIIEHKSAGKDLEAAYNQAMDYIMGIEDRKIWPRYIIVSDFKRIRLIDILEHTDDTILLSDLVNQIEKFGFLAGYNNKRIEGQHPVNIKAAEVMGRLYDILKESNYPEEDLDTLLIRLVFCMFAEDADIFEKNIFSAYLAFHTNDDGVGMAGALTEIFAVLDTPLENRQTTMSSELKNFPYVNGGLFSNQIHAPSFNREMRDILFEASRLDWKYISPAIFGSLFQCIMDPSKRRELGAHYTSEENILKLINPLFMDDLRHEFDIAKGNKKALKELWDKMSDIRILDPACGCGNFLIISYREMRLLEMDLLKELYGNQMVLDESHLYVDHYYGIEISEFASMVANLSIILMDHLMNLEMRNRFGQARDIIPLKEKANIVCADALNTDWGSIVDLNTLSFIIGNPPFVGGMYMSREQKEGLVKAFDGIKGVGELDFVTAWYIKATKIMDFYPNIRAAFVSTNSICQGEQATILWKILLLEHGKTIDFAYTSFVWNNEAKGVAKVHCVIVGFSAPNRRKKIIFTNGKKVFVSNINQYLCDAPTIFVEAVSKPLCAVPPIRFGSMPRDGGYLVIKTKEEKQELIDDNPLCEKWIKPYVGAEEFLNGKERWCLWLVDANPNEIKECPKIQKRIDLVRNERQNSKAAATRKFAATPSLFCQIAQPDSDYILVPGVSSERRKYVPFGFMDKESIASNLVFLVPDANQYHFGIISSDMHMIWMKYVCGRLEMRYRYSKDLVYNTFPWPVVTEKQQNEIAQLANNIIEERKKYPESTLATLYDPDLMPPPLVEAHTKLDVAVRSAYGIKSNDSDNVCITKLLNMYKELQK
ncbi:MAG: class I SAM-dependent DNA methyltransferase [Candidatus Methanomethylophilaceae archaeon]|nr:class I SAM-dependent DNA methyltransferase [Candidatus Methanomethylophilaceae archaeon]